MRFTLSQLVNHLLNEVIKADSQMQFNQQSLRQAVSKEANIAIQYNTDNNLFINELQFTFRLISVKKYFWQGWFSSNDNNELYFRLAYDNEPAQETVNITVNRTLDNKLEAKIKPKKTELQDSEIQI